MLSPDRHQKSQHPSFAALWRRGVSLGEVSRPEALAYAGLDRVITPARPIQPVCLWIGSCPPSSTQVKAVSPPVSEEQLQVTVSAESPAVWAAELPSLVMSAPVCNAPMRLKRDQPMISGAHQIVPASLAKTALTDADAGMPTPGD